MNLIIAQIVKSIIDWINSFFAAIRIKQLKERLVKKKEISNASVNEVRTAYSSLINDIHAYYNSSEHVPDQVISNEIPTADVRDLVEESRRNARKAAEGDRGPGTDSKSKRAASRRTRKATKRRTKGTKK